MRKRKHKVRSVNNETRRENLEIYAAAVLVFLMVVVVVWYAYSR